MMGRRGEQWSLFYQFRLDERVPKDHLLRRIDRFATAALADIHNWLEPYYRAPPALDRRDARRNSAGTVIRDV